MCPSNYITKECKYENKKAQTENQKKRKRQDKTKDKRWQELVYGITR